MADLLRNSTHHYLGGEGAESYSYGLYLADKFQHVDNYVNVDHAVPNCKSNQHVQGSSRRYGFRSLQREDLCQERCSREQ